MINNQGDSMATTVASLANRNQFLFIVAPVLLIGLVADQTSKSWASLRAVEPQILVPGYLAAYSVPNAGIILGLGRDQAPTSLVVAFLGVVCAGLIARVALADRERWPAANCLAGALLLAGIFGNTLDRLALGHVRDFLVAWAIPTVVFNVADLLVILGCAALFMVRFCGGGRSRQNVGFSILAAT
jgi:lipoprotein signal peptidase